MPWLDTAVHNYLKAVEAVLGALGKNLDARKCLWCNYTVFEGELELQQKAQKDYDKLAKGLSPTLWYVGIPQFKLTRREIPSLHCAIDLYYVGTADSSFFGRLIPQANTFEMPCSLIIPLADALSSFPEKTEVELADQGEGELPNAKIIERSPGYSTYSYLGGEWKLPDAFLGFLWAIKDKEAGFGGLLEPLTLDLLNRLLKETPPLVTPGIFEDLVGALTNLGFTKSEVVEASRKTVEKHPNIPLEEAIKLALLAIQTKV